MESVGLNLAIAKWQTAGFISETAHVDVADRVSIDALAATAAQLGPVVHVIHTAGLSRRKPPRRRSSPSTWSAPRTSSKPWVA